MADNDDIKQPLLSQDQLGQQRQTASPHAVGCVLFSPSFEAASPRHPEQTRPMANHSEAALIDLYDELIAIIGERVSDHDVLIFFNQSGESSWVDKERSEQLIQSNQAKRHTKLQAIYQTLSACRTVGDSEKNKQISKTIELINKELQDSISMTAYQDPYVFNNDNTFEGPPGNYGYVYVTDKESLLSQYSNGDTNKCVKHLENPNLKVFYNHLTNDLDIYHRLYLIITGSNCYTYSCDISCYSCLSGVASFAFSPLLCLIYESALGLPAPPGCLDVVSVSCNPVIDQCFSYWLSAAVTVGVPIWASCVCCIIKSHLCPQSEELPSNTDYAFLADRSLAGFLSIVREKYPRIGLLSDDHSQHRSDFFEKITPSSEKHSVAVLSDVVNPLTIPQ